MRSRAIAYERRLASGRESNRQVAKAARETEDFYPQKVGRVRTCRLGLRGLGEEAAWIERHRQLWDRRFDALDKVVEELKKETVDGRT